MVCIVVLNLVGIAAVLSKFLVSCAFGFKTPILAPEMWVFGGFDSLIREQYYHQKALTVAKSRRLNH